MSVSIVSFMLLDIVKVFIIENWSFELTATLWPSPKRRQELEKRQAHKIKMDRIYANFAKVRKVGTIIYAASVFAEQGKLAAAQRNAGVKKQTAGAPHTSIELGY